MGTRAGIDRLSQMAFVLLFVSVGFNALQANKIRELAATQVSVRSQVGRNADDVTGIALDGESRTIALRGQLPTVVYFFSPNCKWCDRNWANVRALARASAGRFRLVGIAAERDLAEFARAHALDFEILGGVSADIRRRLGFASTPHTLVVSSDGRISHEWVGAFDTRRQRSIESFFDMQLPGLLPESPERLPDY